MFKYKIKPLNWTYDNELGNCHAVAEGIGITYDIVERPDHFKLRYDGAIQGASDLKEAKAYAQRHHEEMLETFLEMV